MKTPELPNVQPEKLMPEIEQLANRIKISMASKFNCDVDDFINLVVNSPNAREEFYIIYSNKKGITLTNSDGSSMSFRDIARDVSNFTNQTSDSSNIVVTIDGKPVDTSQSMSLEVYKALCLELTNKGLPLPDKESQTLLTNEGFWMPYHGDEIAAARAVFTNDDEIQSVTIEDIDRESGALFRPCINVTSLLKDECEVKPYESNKSNNLSKFLLKMFGH